MIVIGSFIVLLPAWMRTKFDSHEGKFELKYASTWLTGDTFIS
jgi:hypothetical protein